MKKTLLLGVLATLALSGASQVAQAQGAIVNGATYKLIHYGVTADGSAAAYGVPAGTPLCLDVDNGSAAAGTSVGQWGDISNLVAQRFIFELQTDGSYKIRHAGTTMYIQPVGGAIVAGTQIEQQPTSTANYQRWLITDPNNNGRYKFTLKNSANSAGVSQVLEIGFGSAAPGARVNLYDDNGFEMAQRWQLTLTAAAPLATKAASDAALQAQAYPTVLTPGQTLAVRIEALNSGPAQVELLDVMGRRAYVQSASLRAGTNVLALGHPQLAAGIYLVRLHQGEFTQQMRVVQQ